MWYTRIWGNGEKDHTVKGESSISHILELWVSNILKMFWVCHPLLWFYILPISTARLCWFFWSSCWLWNLIKKRLILVLPIQHLSQSENLMKLRIWADFLLHHSNQFWLTSARTISFSGLDEGWDWTGSSITLVVQKGQCATNEVLAGSLCIKPLPYHFHELRALQHPTFL